MSYASSLGEFVAPFEKEDWPKYVQWNERRPVVLRGSLNPWETERIRYVWEQEQSTWPKIEALKKEYSTREQQIRRDIDIFNAHLQELERVTKKKIGMGPIGQYGGMALAVIPGFGWFSAAFSALTMGLEMLGGNKKKKRINELMGIMEQARQRLQNNQQRLQTIQVEMKSLMDITGTAQQTVETKRKADLQQTDQSYQLRNMQRQQVEDRLSLEQSQIRQMIPTRVRYRNDL